MTQEHFLALMKAADAKQVDGWWRTPDGRQITLYASNGGVSLSVNKVEALKLDAELIFATTVRGDQFVLAAVDVFGGAAEGAANHARKAGFV